MSKEIQTIGEYVKYDGYTVNGKTVVECSDSICVSINPLIGVSNSDIYKDMLDVYNFDTEELVRMSKAALLKVLQGE